MSDATRSGMQAQGLRAPGGPSEGTTARVGAGDQAREAVGHVAQQAKDQASVATARMGDEASRALEDLRAEGEGVAAAAQERALGLAEEGKRAGATQAEGFARALHRAAESLERDTPQLAHFVHDAAGSVDVLARSLRDHSPGELMGRVQDMARRQPVAFFGAAVLAGFALARFARSSAEDHAAPSRLRDEAPRAAGGAGIATPRPAGLGAPGWVPSDDHAGGAPARPATMAGATLGGAASRPAGTDPSAPIPMPGPTGSGSV